MDMTDMNSAATTTPSGRRQGEVILDLQNISLRRMTSPYDVAAMVAFLLSDAGCNISGQSLGVDGNVETL